MEALAAVGLAGNIVQFIDFSCALLNHANSIYRSRSGASKGAQDLETITDSLLDLSARLEKSIENQSQHRDPFSHQNLKALAKRCHDTAKELIAMLLSVKAKKAGSKWHSFRASLAGLMKEAEIDSLEKRLDGYRSQIIIELQTLQRKDYDGIMWKLNDLEKRGQQTSMTLSHEISALRTDIKDVLATLVIELKRGDVQQMNRSHQNAQLDINALAHNLRQTEDSGRGLVATLNILDALRFEGMSHRYTSVREAHTGTFEWAFANQLSKWLQSDDALFWVTGKPGSGKSTLMKRIVDDPRTFDLLRRWSGVEEPVVASYFYWIKGTVLQRSDVGLLRCILFDYLRQCPTATDRVFPAFWANELAQVRRVESIAWRREDLIQAFRRLADLDTMSAHLCLFVDGLDEYQGDHQDLIEVIQYLSRLRIKICVASRPWNVFEHTFGRLPQLRMQELNQPDIEIYVRDHLFVRHDFQRARIAFDDVDVIMSEITEKSQGVFLWVYLVVRSLIEGLRNLDPMSLLMKRLTSFPSDLNDFFHDIFLSLDPIYRNKTAKMFLLTLETVSSPYTKFSDPTTLTTLTHWYLDELEEQPNLPLSLSSIDVDEDSIVQYSSTASLRINGRCKGLLEMIPGPLRKKGVPQGQPESPYWYEVAFLHRTVADFFETPDIQRMLNEWLEEDLNSWSLICQATLAEISAILKFEAGDSLLYLVRPATTRFMNAASLHEKLSGSTLTPLLDELSRLFNHRRICFPPLFTRLAAEYDLLIHVKSLLLSEHSRQQAASKIALLESIHQIVVPRRPLTAEMMCMIHSIGPKVEIGENAQDLVNRFRDKGMSDEEFIAVMEQLSATAYFKLAPSHRSAHNAKRDFASEALHRSLVELVGEEETHRFANFCLQSTKKDRKNDRMKDQKVGRIGEQEMEEMEDLEETEDQKSEEVEDQKNDEIKEHKKGEMKEQRKREKERKKEEKMKKKEEAGKQRKKVGFLQNMVHVMKFRAAKAM